MDLVWFYFMIHATSLVTIAFRCSSSEFKGKSMSGYIISDKFFIYIFKKVSLKRF